MDAFIGSGTTAIAAINTKRNFIGFELNKEYFEIAQNRIEEIKSQISLFDEVWEWPKLDTMLKNHSKQLEKKLIKTKYDTLKKLYGLARNNNFNVNHKELSVKISGRTKHNHELSQLYLDICNKYNHSKQMKWKDLYKILEELTKDKQIEL